MENILGLIIWPENNKFDLLVEEGEGNESEELYKE